MFDTIVLLTGPGEMPVLTGVLLSHNASLQIRQVTTAADLLAIPPAVLRRARLIAFTTPVIVPADILGSLAYGAYNFHPGPPEYPGLSPAQFAVYRGATQFGATAHAMVARVDEGPIIDFELFQVRPGSTVPELEQGSYQRLAVLFWRLAKTLATQAGPLATLPVRWGKEKSSRRSYSALCEIPLDIAKEDLERRVAAFGGRYFGITPTISLHGFSFQLVEPLAEATGTVPETTK